MLNLITDATSSAPDDFYEALIDAHRDLSVAHSHALNARLVLLLANHIGAHGGAAAGAGRRAQERARRPRPGTTNGAP